MALSLLGFGLVLLLAFFGIPLGIVLLLVGIGGFAFVRGGLFEIDSLIAALSMAGQQVLDFSTNYGLSVLPLFVLMGTFIHRAQLSEELYEATHAFLGHRRGGLAMATVAACAGFAAVSGSSLATAATMSKVAMPPMRRYRYADSLAAGTIAAGGTLGILIPPSVPMVIYGILTETDIGKLFIAGILPGILLVVLYFGSIAIAVRLKPEIGPPSERIGWGDRWRALLRVWGVIVLFVLVLGGIYLGVFTPTEAAAIGAAGAMLFAFGRGGLGFRALAASLVDAGRTTAMIFPRRFRRPGVLELHQPRRTARSDDRLHRLAGGFAAWRGDRDVRHLRHPRLRLRQPGHAAADGADLLPDGRTAGR